MVSNSLIIRGRLDSASAVMSFFPERSLLGGITGSLIKPNPIFVISLLAAFESNVGP